MKKIVAFWLVVFSLLAAVWQVGAADTMAKSGTMERVITTKATGASAVETEKLYWKNDKLRIDSYSITGMVTQIKDSKTIYIYLPDAHEAQKAILPDKAAKTVQQMFTEEAASLAGGKKVGSAKVAGFPCNVYILSKNVAGRTKNAKVYRCTDPRLPIPLKMEITLGKTTQTIELRNVKLNPSLSDSLFTLPKGVKVTVNKANTPAAPKTK